MRQSLTMQTALILSLADGGEKEIPLSIKFKVWPARGATLEEPSEDASVEILSVLSNGNALPELLDEFITEDEGLQASLLQHWADDQQEAAEYAAEQRRERMHDDAVAPLSRQEA